MGVFSSIADGWRNFNSRLRTDADFRDEISLMSQAFLSTNTPGEAFGTSAALIRAAREEKARKKLEADLRAAAEAKDAARYADLVKERTETRAFQQEERAARIEDGKRDDAYRDTQGQRAEYDRKAATAARAEQLRLQRISTEDSLATNAVQRQNYQSEIASRADPVRVIAGMNPAQIIAADAALQADPSQMGFMPLDPRREPFAAAAQAMRELPVPGKPNTDLRTAARSYIRSDMNSVDEMQSNDFGRKNTAVLSEAKRDLQILDIAARTPGGEAITADYIAALTILRNSAAGAQVDKFLGKQPDGKYKVVMRGDDGTLSIVYFDAADLAQ